MPELPDGSAPVPATPIGQLAKCHLEIECGRCRHRASIRLDHLASVRGGNVRISEIIRRLRCKGRAQVISCGAKPSRVTLIELDSYDVKAPRVVRRITVVGGG